MCVDAFVYVHDLVIIVNYSHLCPLTVARQKGKFTLNVQDKVH